MFAELLNFYNTQIQQTADIKEMIASHDSSQSPLFMIVSPTAPHNPLNVSSLKNIC